MRESFSRCLIFRQGQWRKEWIPPILRPPRKSHTEISRLRKQSTEYSVAAHVTLNWMQDAFEHLGALCGQLGTRRGSAHGVGGAVLVLLVVSGEERFQLGIAKCNPRFLGGTNLCRSDRIVLRLCQEFLIDPVQLRILTSKFVGSAYV